MKLVVGLGNPGKKYQSTRHNVGFWWLERLAHAANVRVKLEPKFHGRVGRISQPSGEIWLLMPNTYMNESGRAVVALARFYKISPEQILVAHDELDFPAGTVKLKKGGGTGGHNGLTDIAAHIGAKDFWRLRLGIGHPGDKSAVLDYVLNASPPEEAALIEQAISHSLEAWPLIAAGDCQAAMLKLHTK